MFKKVFKALLGYGAIMQTGAESILLSPFYSVPDVNLIKKSYVPVLNYSNKSEDDFSCDYCALTQDWNSVCEDIRSAVKKLQL